MSWLSDFFSGGKNPADAAMPYLNQIPGMEKQYYDPFINRGNEAANTLTPQFNQMSSDPAQFLEGLMGKYQPSRSYRPNAHSDECSSAIPRRPAVCAVVWVILKMNRVFLMRY